MIESMDYNFIMLFLDSISLQGDDGGIFGFIGQGRTALGSDDPIVKGIIPTLFAVLDLEYCLIFSMLQLERRWLIKQS